MYKNYFICLIFSVALFTGCVSTLKELNTIKKIGSLSPGMSHPEVVKIIGQPRSSKFVEDKWVLNYTFCDYLKGWVPYRIVFDKNTKKLVSWYADDEEYQKNKEQVTKVIKSIQDTLEKKKSASSGEVD